IEPVEPLSDDIAPDESVDAAETTETATVDAVEGDDGEITGTGTLLDPEATVNLTGDFDATVNLTGPVVAMPARDEGAANEVTRGHLKGLLEALIFASDKPIKAGELAKSATAPSKQVKE